MTASRVIPATVPSSGEQGAGPARVRRQLGMRHVFAGLGLLLVVAFWLLAPGAYLYDANLALIAAMGAIGLNLLAGYTGQVSIGNAAFMGIGAYSVVLLGGRVPPPVAVLAGGGVAAVVGFLVGLPSLRLRGIYLIFSTLALQFVASFAFSQYDTSTGAIAGHFVKTPTLGPLVLDGDQAWFPVLAALVLAIAVFVSNIVNGRPGRAFAALRTNETAAAVMGVDVTREKLATFATSSFIIGVSGAVGAYFLQQVSYSYFSITLAVSYIAMTLIGGLASVRGAIVGAFVVTMIPFSIQALSTGVFGDQSSSLIQRNLSSINSLVYGLAILGFLYLRPGGIASLTWPAIPRGRTAAVTLGGGVALAQLSPAATRSDAADRASLLEVDDLSVTYRGGAVGVSGLSLALRRGEVMVLLGPNGAGKTSALRGIAGFLPRDPGRATAARISLNGQDVTAHGPLQRCRAGLGMVPEQDKIFTGLTVAENLHLGCLPRSDRPKAERKARALQVFPALTPHLHRRAGFLSGGQRQMLALAMALCADPALLVVDELTLGLSPNLVDELVLSLERLVGEGQPILMAEQSVDVATRLAARVVVLDGGRVVDAGDARTLFDAGRIAAAFTGRH